MLDSSERYIDHKKNLLDSKIELTISKLLNFLGLDYDYDAHLSLADGSVIALDFKVGDKYIEVLDSEVDVQKFERLRKENSSLNLIGV